MLANPDVVISWETPWQSSLTVPSGSAPDVDENGNPLARGSQYGWTQRTAAQKVKLTSRAPPAAPTKAPSPKAPASTKAAKGTGKGKEAELKKPPPPRPTAKDVPKPKPTQSPTLAQNPTQVRAHLDRAISILTWHHVQPERNSYDRHEYPDLDSWNSLQ